MRHLNTVRYFCSLVVGAVVGICIVWLLPQDVEGFADQVITRSKYVPKEFAIEMPNPDSDLGAWQNDSNDVVFTLREIAEDAIKLVTDERLDDAQRSRALGLVECFSPKLTVRDLVKIIDIKDERTAFFADISRGPYPIVTVLKNYGADSRVEGSPVVDSVRFALAREQDPLRRELFCEVLAGVIGTDKAIEVLKVYQNHDDWNEEEKNLLETAVLLLRQRDEANAK